MEAADLRRQHNEEQLRLAMLQRADRVDPDVAQAVYQVNYGSDLGQALADYLTPVTDELDRKAQRRAFAMTLVAWLNNGTQQQQTTALIALLEVIDHVAAQTVAPVARQAQQIKHVADSERYRTL